MGKSEHKIGVFGGSFDPIHTGHLIIAEAAWQQFFLDRVIFMPAGIPPHRGSLVASASQRLEMTKLATMDNPKFEVSDIEINKPGISYTYETLMILQEKVCSKIVLIVGWDAFLILPSWYNAEKLAQNFSFIVAPRITEKSEMPHFPFPVNYQILEAPKIEISSTLIRNKIKTRQSIRYLVPDKVFHYILKENIYG
ncbi:MAG TPA: nicotinate-nucleotide adenylyltransferase [bacterium]|nr:nicotinate-nucleotide adenylyltransferase [bacterium]HOL35359.1 nicotinate-nucleotide adenylyltransferase [bacterium]HPP09199.1 nicotinate-nucleotide adenylyltransferase [bacterium]